jgi:hypothetical protein
MTGDDFRQFEIFCLNDNCGDYIHGKGRVKRKMNFIGYKLFKLAYAYKCPICGRERYFYEKLFGGIAEV